MLPFDWHKTTFAYYFGNQTWKKKIIINKQEVQLD